jgi:nickel/cobalt exporter
MEAKRVSQELTILVITAASIGFFHTLFGPDHYLPFIVMGRARNWSLAKTAYITALCGVGHIGGSVLLGMIGIAAGIGVTRLEALEGVRGNLAAWLLIAFGLVYFAWGLRRAIKNRPHEHKHLHSCGVAHTHEHTHTEEHAHPHETEGKKTITPWVLFTIFVLGPCEPLIPLLMYPAAKSSLGGVVLVAGVFGVITISTMLGIVLVSTLGLSQLPVRRLERYSHALAGATIALSGLAIQFLGL